MQAVAPSEHEREGVNPRIILFLEKGILTLDDEGTASLGVKGKRTTYLHSLIKVSQPVEEWSAVEEAFNQMAKRARAEWEP